MCCWPQDVQFSHQQPQLCLFSIFSQMHLAFLHRRIFSYCLHYPHPCFHHLPSQSLKANHHPSPSVPPLNLPASPTEFLSGLSSSQHLGHHQLVSQLQHPQILN
uniref:Uncharacterized protein n=1 Tax=Opuntia streptacantha TaxID=393608 RepID=A0A7C9D575_OPUST